MKKFYSISQYPGKTGKYFYSSFFNLHKLDNIYIPLGSENFHHTFTEVLSEASGISISMPFKQKVISYLDEKDQNVSEHNSCNTVKIDNKNLIGYNCDLEGVVSLSKYLLPSHSISILGDGCMGKMFAKYLAEYKPNVFSRSLNNWHLRHDNFDVIINCTSLGTSSIESPLNEIPEKTKIVFDLSLRDNNLKKMCFEKTVQYIEGIEFYKAQFLRQYSIYTDINPDPEYFDFICQKMNQQLP